MESIIDYTQQLDMIIDLLMEIKDSIPDVSDIVKYLRYIWFTQIFFCLWREVKNW